jgi:predicted transcriptional regulator
MGQQGTQGTDPRQMAMEVVKAQAGIRNMTAEEMQHMLETLTNFIEAILHQKKEETTFPSGDGKKSIKEKSVICMECGKKFKVITQKHLRSHGLTIKGYKEKWGIKKDVALAARDIVRARRQKMRDMKLWERKKNSETVTEQGDEY